LSTDQCDGGAHPLAAAYYADHARQYRVEISQNVRLAQRTYRVRFECPELAASIVPGQFVMVRLPECNDPLLGRPLALYDTVVNQAGTPVGIDIVYLVIGKMTSRLATLKPGDTLDLWGPLGNGFSAQPVEHLLMVAGGIGQTPFLALGREFLGLRKYGNPPREITPSQQVTLCYGVRTADLLAGAEDFRSCGIDLLVSSDDGSVGHHGLVTEIFEQVLEENPKTTFRVACCGPEPMMEAVAGIARARGVDCEVSLETPMACGIGICFSCVVKARQSDGGWDYKRTCVEGPVFNATSIAW